MILAAGRRVRPGAAGKSGRSCLAPRRINGPLPASSSESRPRGRRPPPGIGGWPTIRLWRSARRCRQLLGHGPRESVFAPPVTRSGLSTEGPPHWRFPQPTKVPWAGTRLRDESGARPPNTTSGSILPMIWPQGHRRWLRRVEDRARGRRDRPSAQSEPAIVRGSRRVPGNRSPRNRTLCRRVVWTAGTLMPNFEATEGAHRNRPWIRFRDRFAPPRAVTWRVNITKPSTTISLRQVPLCQFGDLWRDRLARGGSQIYSRRVYPQPTRLPIRFHHLDKPRAADIVASPPSD